MNSELGLARILGCVLLAAVASACGKTSDDARRVRVESEMKRWLLTQVRDFGRAAEELQKSAPVAVDRGWDAKRDAQAITKMKLAWHRGRVAYELVEGALAPIFPESDTGGAMGSVDGPRWRPPRASRQAVEAWVQA